MTMKKIFCLLIIIGAIAGISVLIYYLYGKKTETVEIKSSSEEEDELLYRSNKTEDKNKIANLINEAIEKKHTSKIIESSLAVDISTQFELKLPKKTGIHNLVIKSLDVDHYFINLVVYISDDPIKIIAQNNIGKFKCSFKPMIGNVLGVTLDLDQNVSTNEIPRSHYRISATID